MITSSSFRQQFGNTIPIPDVWARVESSSNLPAFDVYTIRSFMCQEATPIQTFGFKFKPTEERFGLLLDTNVDTVGNDGFRVRIDWQTGLTVASIRADTPLKSPEFLAGPNFIQKGIDIAISATEDEMILYINGMCVGVVGRYYGDRRDKRIRFVVGGIAGASSSIPVHIWDLYTSDQPAQPDWEVTPAQYLFEALEVPQFSPIGQVSGAINLEKNEPFTNSPHTVVMGIGGDITDRVPDYPYFKQHSWNAQDVTEPVKVFSNRPVIAELPTFRI